MILDLFRLDDRVALVTGAGKGIGRAVALALADAGAHVVCAARTVGDIESTAAEVERRGRRALAVPCDVNRHEDLEALVSAARGAFDRLDVLVNNAGGWPPRPALQTSERHFEAAFHFNVTQAFVLSKLCVPFMVASAGGGSVVNVSSRAGGLVQPAFVAYGTAKAALDFMTRQLAAEWAPKVRVNAIACGGVETDALKVVLTDPALRKQLEDNTPMRRIGRVEDVAACALYLASPAAAWVTGKILEVDGGTEVPAFTLPVEPL